MPSGLKRLHHSGQTHFITFTCYHRWPHLATEIARNASIGALEDSRQKYGFRVYAFVLMPEHVHLLISEPARGTVAQAIQSFKISSARRCAEHRVDPEHPFWQARYYDRNVRDYREFMEKLQYIHRNPVKRGLCSRPEDWRWSSFCHCATGAECGLEIESTWTARTRDNRVGVTDSPQ